MNIKMSVFIIIQQMQLWQHNKICNMVMCESDAQCGGILELLLSILIRNLLSEDIQWVSCPSICCSVHWFTYLANLRKLYTDGMCTYIITENSTSSWTLIYSVLFTTMMAALLCRLDMMLNTIWYPTDGVIILDSVFCIVESCSLAVCEQSWYESHPDIP
jgi:hypothetical protein